MTDWNYNKNWYSKNEGGTKSYWGYIRPDFGSIPTNPTTNPTTHPTNPPIPQHDPIGVLDSVEVSGNMIVVKGWAFDYDNTAANIDIHAYIDDGQGGQFGIGSATANKGRPDVNDAYNGVGECHGFDAAFGCPRTGTFNVYVYAMNNVGEGSQQLIGQRQVTVTGNDQPDIYGNYENAVADGTKITVVGWAFDKADTSKCTGIHVYIDDGNGGQQYIGGGGAVELRQDVDDQHHSGKNHGFYFSVDAPRTGTYNVYVYAISVNNTSSKLLGSKQVTVSPASVMSINKTICRRNDNVTFTFYSNNSPTVYTIGIDKNGTRVITQNVTSPFTISTLDEGSYTAYVTAFNPTTGSCDSNTVSFTVSDLVFAPKKSVAFNGHTYTLYDGNLTWQEAKVTCSNLGGNLVTITSEQEQNAINDLLAGAEAKYYWIGLSDAQTEGNYQWVTGEERSYTNWCAGQPDDWNNAEDYIFILRDGGGWNDSGDLALGFILEQKSTYTITYDANGGTNAPSTQSKPHGTALTLSNTEPSRTGYEFLGWSTDKNATVATYNAGDTFTNDADTTLYAVWEKITLSSIAIKTKPTKLTYNTGDTLDISGLILTNTYSDGSTMEIPATDITVRGDNDTIEDTMSGIKCSPAKLNTAGTQTVTVVYGDKTATFDVTVAAPIQITQQPVNASVYNGSQATYTVKATGAGLKYQWYYKKANDTSWSRYTNGTTATITLTAQEDWNNAKVYCKITDTNGKTLNTTSAKLIVTIQLTQQPADTSVPEDGTATYTVKATGAGLTYQWYYKKANDTSWSRCSNGTAATLTLTALEDWNNAKVYCKITSITGKTLNTRSAKLTVGPAINITQQPADASVLEGCEATYTVKADGADLKYQWFYKKANDTSWAKCDNGTAATLTLTALEDWNNAKVYCKITNVNGKTLNTRSAKLTVGPAISITQQPADTSALEGCEATYTVKADGANLKYQWFYKKANDTSWAKCTNGTAATLTLTALEDWNNAKVFCKIADANGKTLNSRSAKLTVGPAISITQQPVDTSGSNGYKVTYTVKADGVGLKYQWYYKKANDTSWSKYANGTSATLTLTVQEDWNNAKVYCKITNVNGKTLNTRSAKLTVGPAINITQQPADASILDGFKATYTVKADGANLKYQWYYKKANDTSWSKCTGGTDATLTLTVQEDWNNAKVYCRITSITGKALNTRSAKLAVKPAISITQQPVDTSGSNGYKVTYTVKADGVGLKYQWYYKKANDTSWSKYANGTSATLTLTVQEDWNNAKVYCKIADTNGKTFNTRSAKLTVI